MPIVKKILANEEFSFKNALADPPLNETPQKTHFLSYVRNPPAFILSGPGM
jgi:hypothetical protein